MNPDWIVPDWPAPASVHAISTTRPGGFSSGPWSSLNLGLNCSDDPLAVGKNRAVLCQYLPAEPRWLSQAHGTDVFRYPDSATLQAAAVTETVSFATLEDPVADAQVAYQPGQVCAILTADCLPVLLCNRAGTKVGAAHAGWRGLAAGVLEQTVHALGDPPGQLMAWLGPAIGPSVYEVGNEVRTAFLRRDEQASVAFAQQGDRWLFDLYTVARQRLQRAGISDISGGNFCTYSEPGRFFSYRRDAVTGRMASLVWLHR